MKYFLLSAFCLIAFFNDLHATVWTVTNQKPQVNGQFNNLQAAHNAASPGDTIYLTPSNQPHNSASISKNLTIIGSGYAPTKAVSMVSFLIAVSLSGNNLNVKFDGVTFLYGSNIFGDGHSLYFKNCWFSNNLTCFGNGHSYDFSSCIFADYLSPLNSDGTSRSLNIYTKNCIFEEGLTTDPNLLLTGMVFSCNFLGNPASSYLATKTSYFYTYNCIFYGTSPIVTTPFSETIFQDCISFGGYNPNSNGTQNNITIANPQFINYAIGTGFKTTDNYHVSPSSPALSGGYGGGEIGLYGAYDLSGGPSQFTMTGEPDLPQIRSITGPTTPIQSGSTFTINITSTVKP